ncbi:MAG: hypothetical protein P8X47_01710 [Ignavibacteriaceae bacterium]
MSNSLASLACNFAVSIQEQQPSLSNIYAAPASKPNSSSPGAPTTAYSPSTSIQSPKKSSSLRSDGVISTSCELGPAS